MRNSKLKKEVLKISNANKGDVRIAFLKELINLNPTGNHYEKVIAIKKWFEKDENAKLVLNVLDQYEKWVLGWLLPNLTIEFRAVLASGAYNFIFGCFVLPTADFIMGSLEKKDEPEIMLEIYETDRNGEYGYPKFHKLEHGKIVELE